MKKHMNNMDDLIELVRSPRGVLWFVIPLFLFFISQPIAVDFYSNGDEETFAEILKLGLKSMLTITFPLVVIYMFILSIYEKFFRK